MNSRKSAKAIPSTLNRFLKSRALLKSPPPAFYPLAAHPPPPSLVRSFPTRDEQDLAPNSPTRSVLEAQRLSAQEALNKGLRLQPHQLLDSTPLKTSRGGGGNVRTTRRKPPKKFNPKQARPEEIVFPEDDIRKRFYLDHPFEAYRPVSLVENDRVRNGGSVEGLEWTELRQVSLNPSPEDCISFIQNLVSAHELPLSTAYPLGITQYRTLRSEFETATLSARLQAQAHGATFFGEIERSVLVEEKVLDGWVRAKEVQDGFAVSGGAGQQSQQQQSALSVMADWSPVEGRPAQLGSTSAGLNEGEAVFTGGREYLQQFDQRRVGSSEEEKSV
ncbi:mitochondrial 37S ribosomal protein mS23 RSM25 [Sporobolomyces salmoneus]|uniref:mitochondrial 37S ribosomal protein mS23 RSM25 n=1 Tax=Sporobolomyces salmoneus TaxID=183962 RepID=UPI003176BC56